jgi:hypothetical protein
MNNTLTGARESARNAARASLLAMRSMVDARIRRVERKQAAVHASGATAAPDMHDGSGEEHPHEIG